MRHIDRHKLELFILGSVSVKRDRRSIERHLASCVHCRAIGEEIGEIYSTAADHIRTRGRMSEEASAAVARRRESLLEGRIPVEVTPLPEKRGPVQMFAGFVRKHPLITVSGSFAAVAIAAFIAGRSVPAGSPDPEVATFHYEVERGVLSVQNSRGGLLWEKPVYRLRDEVSTEEFRRIQFTMIQDVNGDGHKELITTLPFKGEGGVPELNRIGIFGGSTEPTVQRSLAHSVTWNGAEYTADGFGSGGFVILKPEAGRREIVASIPAFRSPTLVIRLDGNGRTLGEYWHHGHLPGIYTVRPGGKGEERLVLAGINDAEPKGVERSAVIVMLDPKELKDTTESSATPGYGYPPSTAELVYLRIPVSDIAKALQQIPLVQYVIGADSERIGFVVANSLDLKVGGAFEYIFSSDLRILDVRPIDGIEAIHATLLKEGKIRSTFDRAYLDSLKSAVEYWDGHSWGKGYSPIHSSASNK